MRPFLGAVALIVGVSVLQALFAVLSAESEVPAGFHCAASHTESNAVAWVDYGSGIVTPVYSSTTVCDRIEPSH